MTAVDGPQQLLTVLQVAQRLGVSEDTVRRRIAAGQLAGVKLGYRTLRVSVAELARYLDAAAAGPGAA